MSTQIRKDVIAVELINLDELNQLMSKPVEVSIQDEEGEICAPFIRKEIMKLEHCPDNTHLRIYFDQHNFFAIPLSSKVQYEGDDWTATDIYSKLKYVIRRVRES